MNLQPYKTFVNEASYLHHPLSPETRNLILSSLAAQLATVEFDQIVVSGVSGITMGSMLAFMLDKPLVVVRKNIEDGHSSKLWEGRQGGKAVIVDDFVSTGTTMKRLSNSCRQNYAKPVACVFYATDRAYGGQYGDADNWRFDASLSGVPVIVPKLQDAGFESLAALCTQRYRDEEVAA